MLKKLFGKQKKIKMAEGSTSVSQDTPSSSGHAENSSQETENSSHGQKTMFVQTKEYLDQVQVSEDPKLDRFIKGWTNSF